MPTARLITSASVSVLIALTTLTLVARMTQFQASAPPPPTYQAMTLDEAQAAAVRYMTVLQASMDDAKRAYEASALLVGASCLNILVLASDLLLLRRRRRTRAST